MTFTTFIYLLGSLTFSVSAAVVAIRLVDKIERSKPERRSISLNLEELLALHDKAVR